MFLFKLFTVFIIMVAILLIGTILLQEPKERIMPSGGGAMSVQRISINQKADFLEKATWVLVGLLLCLTLLSSMLLKYDLQSSTLMIPDLAKLQQAQALDSTVVPDTTSGETIASEDQEMSSTEAESTTDKKS